MRYGTFFAAVADLSLIGASAYAAVAAGKAAESRLPDVLPTDRDAILELPSRLTDADVRELLRRQLEHGIAGHQAGLSGVAATSDLVGSFDSALGVVRARLAEMLSVWPKLPSIVTSVGDWLATGRSVWQPLVAVAFAAAVLAVAFSVEWLALRLFGSRAPGPSGIRSPNPLAAALAEAIFGILRIAIFSAAALLFFIALYQGHEASRQVVLGILGGVVATRLTALVSHVVIQPEGSGSSWLILPPTITRLLHRQVVGLGVIAGVAYVSAGMVRAAGIEVALINLYDLLLAIILCGWIIATILVVRRLTRSSGADRGTVDHRHCIVRLAVELAIAGCAAAVALSVPAIAAPPDSGSKQDTLTDPREDDADGAENNGNDLTRPQGSFDVRLRYRPSSGANTRTDQKITILQLSNRLAIDSNWKLAVLARLPLVAKATTTSNPDAMSREFGIGDALFQAALIHTIDKDWAFGFGARLVAPTAEDNLGTGKWQIMPGFGVRYSLPALGPDSYFVPAIRYAVSFAGDPSRRNISQPQIAPTLNIGLADRWFVTLYPSYDIRINYGDPVPGQTGRLFLPFDAAIGRKLTDNLVAQLEASVPIVKDYPIYDYKIEARLSLKY